VFKFVVLFALLAIAVYLTVRVIQKRGILDEKPTARPWAPDDDSDFLRDLDRRHKHPEDPDA
jgi:hypothetical protein